MTIVQGNFEWDSEKDKINREKHGFSFSQIIPAFDDPYFFEILDIAHSTISEERLIGIGRLNETVVVVTCYTERNKIRLYSARRASKKEEALYYEQWKKLDI